MTTHPLPVLADDELDAHEELARWFRQLSGCPPITHTALTSCDQHSEEQQTWCYIEADPAAGVARRRCVACAATRDLLDSSEHWTYPVAHMCPTCHQSLMEVGIAVSAEDDESATWLALAARCVECGRIDGLTDLVLGDISVEEALEPFRTV